MDLLRARLQSITCSLSEAMLPVVLGLLAGTAVASVLLVGLDLLTAPRSALRGLLLWPLMLCFGAIPALIYGVPAYAALLELRLARWWSVLLLSSPYMLWVGLQPMVCWYVVCVALSTHVCAGAASWTQWPEQRPPG